MKNRPKPQPHSSQADESSKIKKPSANAVLWSVVSTTKPGPSIGSPGIETKITGLVLVEARLFHEAREIVRTYFGAESAVLQESRLVASKLPPGSILLRRTAGGAIRGVTNQDEQKGARA